MSRYVVIATMLRGVLTAPEPLDEAGQQQAAQQAYVDDLRDSLCDARVVWNRTSGEKREKPVYNSIGRAKRIERMLHLAESAQ